MFNDHAHVQRAFDEWRDIYNTVRPHQGIGMLVPSTRYRPSPRPFPEVLPAIEYSPHDHVTTVQSNGIVKFKGQTLKVSNALRGLPIAFRPDDAQDGVYSLYFAHHRLMQVDLRETA